MYRQYHIRFGTSRHEHHLYGLLNTIQYGPRIILCLAASHRPQRAHVAYHTLGAICLFASPARQSCIPPSSHHHPLFANPIRWRSPSHYVYSHENVNDSSRRTYDNNRWRILLTPSPNATVFTRLMPMHRLHRTQDYFAEGRYCMCTRLKFAYNELRRI